MKVKHWTTKKIIEVLDDAPYYRGTTGKDYTDYVDELKDELWRRQNKQTELEFKRGLKEYNYENK